MAREKTALPKSESTSTTATLQKVPTLLAFAENIGLSIRNFFLETAYLAGFITQVLRETLLFFRKRQAGYKVLAMQILFTGVEAMGIISILSLALGTIIIVLGFSQLVQWGQISQMYSLLILIITRELGPLLTAFIIIARSGTAIATEIASMVVSHEIEAYIAAGINPISYLVVPRFVGVMVSMVILTIYFSVLGLLGSSLIAGFITTIPFDEYWHNLLLALAPGDIGISLLKATVFGGIVSIVSTFEGFAANRSSTEIPQAGLRAVGKCFIACIMSDALITVIYYLYL